MLSIEIRTENKFWAHSSIFEEHVFLMSILRSTPNHTPLEYDEELNFVHWCGLGDKENNYQH